MLDKIIGGLGIGAMFLIALLFAFAITRGTPACDPFIAEWVSAIATCAGVFIAAGAFWIWRWPDEAKRRADLAQELLRKVHKAQTSLLSARSPHMIVDLADQTRVVTEDAMIDALESINRNKDHLLPKLAEARSQFDDLEAYKVEAEAILGPNVSRYIEELRNLFSRLDTGYLLLDILTYRTGPFRTAPRFRVLLRETIETFGVTWNDDPSNPSVDVFRGLVTEAANNLRRGLIGHVVR